MGVAVVAVLFGLGLFRRSGTVDPAAQPPVAGEKEAVTEVTRASSPTPSLLQELPETAGADAVPETQWAGEADLSELTVFYGETARLREGFGSTLTLRDRQVLAGLLEDLHLRRMAALRARAEVEGIPFEGDTEDGRGFRLEGFENGEAVFVYTANMIQAAESSAVAPWVRWNADFDPVAGPNIDGTGLIVNVVDLGTIYDQHQEFFDAEGISRILVRETAAAGSDASRRHMTEAASVLGAWGVREDAVGIAPRVRFRTFASGDPLAPMYGSGMAHPSQTHGAVVTNRSIGGTSGSTLYSFAARDGDRAAVDTPYHLLVNSAGNNGSGFETIGSGVGLAKNVLTIGETGALHRNEDGSYLSGGSVVSQSSRGPAGSGRIKPDFVTRGSSMRAARSGTNSYSTPSGTSFASPHAAGTVVILADHFRQRFPGRLPRAATIRALLVNGADDLGNPGPDYLYGYGAINTLASARLIRDYADQPQRRHLIEDALHPGGTWMQDYTVTEAGRVRVALSWLDPAFSSQTSNPVIVNNLHVRVFGPDGAVHYPFVMPRALDSSASFSAHAVRAENHVDPNLLVEISNAAPGSYTVEVYHDGTLLDGVPQEFSLAVSGMAASGLANPEILLSSPLVLNERSKLLIRIPVADMLVGATVRLERAGVADVEIQSVGREEGHATVVLNPVELTPGFWNVRLLNPDGSEALAPNALLVNAAPAFHLLWDMQSDPGFTLEADGAVFWSFGNPGGVNNEPMFGPYGPQVLGTNPGGNFSGEFDVSATSPVVDLSGASGLMVNVHHWLNKDSSVRADFEVQVNGGSWVPLWSNGFMNRWNRWQLLNSGNPWSEGPIALPASVEDESEVRFRFRLQRTMSSATQDLGWYLGGFEIFQETVPTLFPPVFTSEPVTELSAGQPFSYTAVVTDADTPLDSLTWALESAPAWLSLTDNGDGTVSLSGTAEAGSHPVLLRVSDGDYDTWQEFTLDVDSSLVFTGFPAFTGSPGASTATVQTQNTGGSLTLAALTLPGWLTFTDNGDGSGTLTQQSFDGNHGAHDVVIQANNGEETVTLSFVAYRQMQDRVLTLHAYTGGTLAVLAADPDLDATTISALLAGLEAGWAFYVQSTGRLPFLWFQYDGLPTIAEVPDGTTCGAGCGFLGFTGIELTQSVFSALYEGVRDRNEFDQAVFYEMGRNFWFYSDALSYQAPDDVWVVATGYAVWMRFIAMEAAGLAGGAFNGNDFADFEAEVRGLLDTYFADESRTWHNTLRVGQGVPNGMGLGATDLFAAFLFRLRDVYGAGIPGAIWQEANDLPAADNTQGALDNFIRAASAAAGENLAPLFAYWRWPVPAALQTELATAYPGSAPGELGFTVSEVTVDGDAGTAVFSVTRQGGSAGEVSVRYTTASGSATAGTHYQSVSGTLTWADGDTTAKSIPLEILPYATPEDLTVELTLTLSHPTDGAMLSANDALTVSIFYEAEIIPIVPEITLLRPTVSDVRIPEGVGLVLKTDVTETGGSTGQMTLLWELVSGDGTVSWDNTDQENTAAWFSAQGSYVLRLTAGNGEDSDVLEIAVEVVDAGGSAASAYTAEDVGPVEINGSSSFDAVANSFTLGLHKPGSSAGDIWASPDSFRFVYSELEGDGAITARIESLTGDVQWSKVGLMMRASNAGNAMYAATLMTDNQGVLRHQRRTSTDGGSSRDNSTSGDKWLRLVRSGDTFTSYRSADGVSWTPIGHHTNTNMPATLLVGLALAPQNSTNPMQAVFRDLQGFPLNGNRGPLVFAGDPRTVALDQNAVLSGTVEDDGLPEVPGTVNTEWIQLSGPETVTLGEAAALTTTFTPAMAGDYAFRLVAFDGEVATASDVIITVEESPLTPFEQWLADNALEGQPGEIAEGTPLTYGALFTMGASLSGEAWEGILYAEALGSDGTGGMILTFTAQPGRQYTLQRSEHLQPADWQNVGDPISHASGEAALQTFTFDLPETGPQFFRIRVEILD